MSTEDKVRTVTSEHLGVKPEQVIVTAKFRDDLGADSLDMIELAMAFEEEFGIEISDASALSVGTVGDAVELIDSKILAQ